MRNWTNCPSENPAFDVGSRWGEKTALKTQPREEAVFLWIVSQGVLAAT